MTASAKPPLSVGLGGFGAIGGAVARRLDAGVDGLVLAAVSARDRARAERRMSGFRRPARVVDPGELPGLADVVVECAPAAAFAAWFHNRVAEIKARDKARQLADGRAL